MKSSVLNHVWTAHGFGYQKQSLVRLVLLPAALTVIGFCGLTTVMTVPVQSGMPNMAELCRIALEALALMAGIFVLIGWVVPDDPARQPIWVRCDEIVIGRALYLLTASTVVLAVLPLTGAPLGAELFPMLGYFVYCRRKPAKARTFALVALSLGIVRILTNWQFGLAYATTVFWAISLQWLLCALSYVVLSTKDRLVGRPIFNF